MKIKKHTYIKITVILGLILVTLTGCERGLSEEAELATFPTNGDIFIDSFVGGLDYFPFGGSFAEAFSVDQNESFMGTASMRFDIPVFGVGFGGATFPSTGPRDLSGYDALTFWAKASKGADINEIGFGVNGDTNNQYQVTLQNMPITTNWKKYTIPIPDASKLNQEIGMFWYAEGAENAADEGGYTFWIDELKFERLGTIAQPRPAIFNGVDEILQTVKGSTTTITGTQTFNLGTGEDITVIAAPSYFNFMSSDESIAIVNERGEVTILGSGKATITASIDGVLAKGSLTVDSSLNINPAPTPTRAANTVISVYSNAYTNVNVDTFNGNFGGSTTQTTFLKLGNDDLIFNTNVNFAGIQFQNPTIDASSMNFLHLDVFIVSDTSSPSLSFNIRDRGANGELNTNVNTGGPTEDDQQIDFTIPSAQLVSGQWISVDIPLTGGLATQKNNLAQIAFSGNVDFILDNIYFYE